MQQDRAAWGSLVETIINKAQYDTKVNSPCEQRCLRGEPAMSARPTDIREANAARIARGELVPDGGRHRGGEGVIDPRNAFARAPKFEWESQLPKPYEAYVKDCVAAWGGDPGPYACAFLAMHCAVLDASVVVQTNPTKPNNWRNPNDFSLTLGRSGQKKSGMFKDITRFQAQWHRAQSMAASRSVGKGPKFRPMLFLQSASIEGMMRQIVDNKSERLLVGSEEAMAFYAGAAAHRRDDAARVMASDVCAAYDGGNYAKRLVKEILDIPQCLSTLVMTTVFEKFVGWRDFNTVMGDGLWARHTVGLVAYPESPNPEAVNHEAEKELGVYLLKMRGMRNYRFVLSPEAGEKWLVFRDNKEKAIEDMAELGDSEGLELWCRKYDMRIMSMATIFQMYEFIDGGMTACTETPMPMTESDKVQEAKVQRTVTISTANLSRAIAFVEGYLYDVQEYFYKVARGVTQWGPELINFMAYRIAIKNTENDERILSRNDLTYSGPSKCRGSVTPELKETHKSWLDALLDHGFVEPHQKATGYNAKKPRADNEYAHYRIRDEFYEFFSGVETLQWAAQHDAELKAKMKANGIGPFAKRRPLKL